MSITRGGAAFATYHDRSNANRTVVDARASRPVTAQYDRHDRLLRHGTTTYCYTAAGALRERETATGESTLYDYDASGSLTGVDLPGGRTIGYLTDGLGRRIATKVDAAIDGGAAAIGGVSLAKTTKPESLRNGAAAIANVPATPELASLYGFNRRVQPLLHTRRANRDFSLKYGPIAAARPT